MEPDARPLHPLRRRPAAPRRRRRPAGGDGLGRRGAADLRRRGPAAPAGRLAARLPPLSRRLGEGRRRQHRLLAGRRAAALPRHVALPLSRGGALPERPAPHPLPGALQHPPGPAPAAPFAGVGGGLEAMTNDKLTRWTAALFLVLLV